MRRRPESRHRRRNRPSREVFCPAERPRGTFAAKGVVFSPTEPFVLSGDACGSTFSIWSQGLPVGRPMPRRNQTLTGRSPNAPSPSVSATSSLTSSGPTSESRRSLARRSVQPRGRERRRLSGGILASRTVRYARGCLRADVPPRSKGHGVDHSMRRCQDPRRFADIVGPSIQDVVRETLAAKGGYSRPPNRSFRPGMPVGRRSPGQTANGLVARCPVAIKRGRDGRPMRRRHQYPRRRY